MTMYEIFVRQGNAGKKENVDFIMNYLDRDSEFFVTRLADFALGLVESDEGIDHIKHYLFNGSSIQRNYAALTLNRIDEWKSVQKAFKLGLVDETQTFAR